LDKFTGMSTDMPAPTPSARPVYRFEWDSNKERTNVLKHDGVTFRLASTVLHDPLAITL
jgi:uncharacterized protein